MDLVKREQERVQRRMKDIETGKKWNFVDEIRQALEQEFSNMEKVVPEFFEVIVRKGENQLKLKAKMLKVADKESWGALNNFLADLLCDVPAYNY